MANLHTLIWKEKRDGIAKHQIELCKQHFTYIDKKMITIIERVMNDTLYVSWDKEK